MKTPEIKVTYMGEQMSLKQLAEVTGINHSTIKWRYAEQYRGEDLWRKPIPAELRPGRVVVTAGVNPRREREQAKRERLLAELNALSG